MYYCYIFIIATFLLSYLYFIKKKENDKLKNELRRLRQEIKGLKAQKEEERIKEIQEIMKITEGLSKYEDGKLYLTSEAIQKLKTEWKLSRKELKQRLEELNLKMIGRTRKSINGEIRYAYILELEGKNGK
jgi:DNA repair exonuclease SbcCD ATPase subunit